MKFIDRSKRNYFFIPMISTFFVLVLITGFTVVEKNARAVIFEDNPPFFVCRQKNFRPELIKIHFMGKDFIFNF